MLGIGDTSYDSLEDNLKQSLTEYYRVDSLEDYDQVLWAVAFFKSKSAMKACCAKAGVSTAHAADQEAALEFIRFVHEQV